MISSRTSSRMSASGRQKICNRSRRVTMPTRRASSSTTGSRPMRCSVIRRAARTRESSARMVIAGTDISSPAVGGPAPPVRRTRRRSAAETTPATRSSASTTGSAPTSYSASHRWRSSRGVARRARTTSPVITLPTLRGFIARPPSAPAPPGGRCGRRPRGPALAGGTPMIGRCGARSQGPSGTARGPTGPAGGGRSGPRRRSRATRPRPGAVVPWRGPPDGGRDPPSWATRRPWPTVCVHCGPWSSTPTESSSTPPGSTPRPGRAPSTPACRPWAGSGRSTRWTTTAGMSTAAPGRTGPPDSSRPGAGPAVR